MGSKGDIVLRSKLMSSKDFVEKMKESEAGKKTSKIPVDSKEKLGEDGYLWLVVKHRRLVQFTFPLSLTPTFLIT